MGALKPVRLKRENLVVTAVRAKFAVTESDRPEVVKGHLVVTENAIQIT